MQGIRSVHRSNERFLSLRILPSGGLVPEDYTRVTRDIKGGMLTLIYQQFRCLRRLRHKYDLAVAVGDMWAVIMAILSSVMKN